MSSKTVRFFFNHVTFSEYMNCITNHLWMSLHHTDYLDPPLISSECIKRKTVGDLDNCFQSNSWKLAVGRQWPKLQLARGIMSRKFSNIASNIQSYLRMKVLLNQTTHYNSLIKKVGMQIEYPAQLQTGARLVQ